MCMGGRAGSFLGPLRLVQIDLRRERALRAGVILVAAKRLKGLSRVALRVVVAVAALVGGHAARANEGLYLGFGAGYAGIASDQLISVQGVTDRPAFMFRLGYNIMSYASIELLLQGNGHNLTSPSDAEGSANGSLIAKFHPLPIFKKDFWVDPYIGTGLSYVAYFAQPPGGGSDDAIALMGWGGSFGLGADVYLVKYVSVGAAWWMTIPNLSQVQENENTGFVDYVENPTGATTGARAIGRSSVIRRVACEGGGDYVVGDRANVCKRNLGGALRPAADEIEKQGSATVHNVLLTLTFHIPVASQAGGSLF